MKSWIFPTAAVISLIVVGLFVAGCTKGNGTSPDAGIKQKLCPVMGNPINKDIYLDYQGRRIYFCCNMCPDVFKKDPEKYLKKLDEQMKEPETGKTETKP